MSFEPELIMALFAHIFLTMGASPSIYILDLDVRNFQGFGEILEFGFLRRLEFYEKCPNKTSSLKYDEDTIFEEKYSDNEDTNKIRGCKYNSDENKSLLHF